MLQIVLPIAALLAGLGSVAAAEAQDLNAARQACLADYTKHCTSVAPGGGRVKKCLIDNVVKLTPACKAALVGPTNADKGRS